MQSSSITPKDSELTEEKIAWHIAEINNLEKPDHFCHEIAEAFFIVMNARNSMENLSQETVISLLKMPVLCELLYHLVRSNVLDPIHSIYLIIKYINPFEHKAITCEMLLELLIYIQKSDLQFKTIHLFFADADTKCVFIYAHHIADYFLSILNSMWKLGFLTQDNIYLLEIAVNKFEVFAKSNWEWLALNIPKLMTCPHIANQSGFYRYIFFKYIVSEKLRDLSKIKIDSEQIEQFAADFRAFNNLGTKLDSPQIFDSSIASEEAIIQEPIITAEEVAQHIAKNNDLKEPDTHCHAIAKALTRHNPRHNPHYYENNYNFSWKQKYSMLANPEACVALYKLMTSHIVLDAAHGIYLLKKYMFRENHERAIISTCKKLIDFLIVLQNAKLEFNYLNKVYKNFNTKNIDAHYTINTFLGILYSVHEHGRLNQQNVIFYRRLLI